MIFQWKPASRISGIKPEVAGEIMTEIAESNNGKLTPQMLVEASKPKGAPLHSYFEWDNKKAGALYREVQAGHLIRCIVIVPEEAEPLPDKEPKTIRAFFPTGPKVSETEGEPDEERGYESTITIFSDEEKRARLLESALEELNSWRNRYKTIKAFAGIFESIEKVHGNIQEIRVSRRQKKNQQPAATA